MDAQGQVLVLKGGGKVPAVRQGGGVVQGLAPALLPPQRGPGVPGDLAQPGGGGALAPEIRQGHHGPVKGLRRQLLGGVFAAGEPQSVAVHRLIGKARAGGNVVGRHILLPVGQKLQDQIHGALADALGRNGGRGGLFRLGLLQKAQVQLNAAYQVRRFDGLE